MAGPASGEATDVVRRATAKTTRGLVDGARCGTTATRAAPVTSASQSSCEDTETGRAPPSHDWLVATAVTVTSGGTESSSNEQAYAHHRALMGAVKTATSARAATRRLGMGSTSLAGGDGLPAALPIERTGRAGEW
jgi:hypothetical protein